jgi:phospholipid transport system substrate-binding protein
MRQRRRLFLLAAVLTAGTVVAPTARSAASVVDESRQVIQGMSSQVLSVLRNQGLSRPARERRFASIFRNYFDVPTIGRWVMGRAWRKANARQRAQLMRLFEAYIVKTYTIQLSKYTGEQVKVVGANPDGPGAVVISHIVNRDGSRPIVLKWRMRRTRHGVKVRDVVIDNISMSLNQRREFAAVYRSHGSNVNGLIAAMRDKVAELDRK